MRFVNQILHRLNIFMEIKASGKYHTDHLDLLAKILNFEISFGILFLISFAVSIFLFIAGLLAAVFVPFLIYVLLKEGKHGWIIFFNLTVILPLLFSYFFVSSYFAVFVLITLAMFYFYCFLLRLSVNDWIRERNWRLQLIEQRKQTEAIKISGEN